MSNLVALLRGINVGPSTRLAMADLREVLASLGYADIHTLLNSGNAVFMGGQGSPAEEAARIQTALTTRLGFKARVIVKSRKEFTAIVTDNPLLGLAANPSRLIVGFTQEPATLSRVAALQTTDWSPEALAVGKFALYMWCPNGMIPSKVAQEVGRKLGDLLTARSWTTVEKINILLQGAIS